jgi:sec-independent protein translocase protein TatA
MPLGPWELAIILVIVIVIFGVGKLPEIGGAIGQGIREFRETTKDLDKTGDTAKSTPAKEEL